MHLEGEGTMMSVRSSKDRSGTARGVRPRGHRYQVVATVSLLAGALLLPGQAAYAATPTCFGQTATLTGTAGDDPALTGTSGADVIVGLGGNDTINGGAGNDLICGNAGNDTIG